MGNVERDAERRLSRARRDAESRESAAQAEEIRRFRRLGARAAAALPQALERLKVTGAPTRQAHIDFERRRLLLSPKRASGVFDVYSFVDGTVLVTTHGKIKAPGNHGLWTVDDYVRHLEIWASLNRSITEAAKRHYPEPVFESFVQELEAIAKR